MRLRAFVLGWWLAGAALCAGGCNLIFSIQPGEPLAGSGGAAADGGPATSTGTSTSTGGATCTPAVDLSDDFNDPATLPQWHLLTTVEQTPPLHDILDIGTTTPSQLTMRPMPTTMNGWYAQDRGPFLYKDVTGDFMVAVRVSAGTLTSIDTAPTRTFNTAGIMARSSGASADWVLIDVGFQDPTDSAIQNLMIGAMAKNTTNGVTVRTPAAGGQAGWLGICRIGDNFDLLRKLDGEAAPTVQSSVNRPDLGATVQVGLVVGTWVAQERDVFGRFDYAHFSIPTSAADCQKCLLE